MNISLNKNISNIFLFLAILSVLLFYLTQYLNNKNHSSYSESKYLTEHIDLQSFRLLKEKHSVENIIKNYPKNYWNKLDSLFSSQKYICFIANQDSVSYWNTNKVDVAAISKLVNDKSVHVINLPSGWYLYSNSIKSGINITVLEIIKSDFIVNNKLLKPVFSPKYANSSNLNLTLNLNESSYQIYNSNGDFILGTNFVLNKQDQNNSNYLLFVLFLISYISIIIYILLRMLGLKLTKTNPHISLTIFITIVLVLRIIENTLNFSSNLKQTQLFTNIVFSIPTSISHGDILLNTLLLIVISVAIFLFFQKSTAENSSLKILLGYTLLWIYVLIIIFILFHTILDQQIYFFSEDIFHNNAIFLSTLVIIGLNISMYYLFITYLNTNRVKNIPFIIPFITVAIGIFVTYILTDIPISILIITITVVYILIILKQTIWKYLTDQFINRLLLLVLLSIVSSIVVSNSYALKNDNYQKFIGNTLSITSDTAFENKYKKVATNIISDKKLLQFVFKDTTANDDLIQEYILKKYFSKTANKYSIQITNCGENEFIEIQPEGEIYACSEYFDQLISEFTTPVIDSSLFKFSTNTESIYYISKITLVDPNNSDININLYIEYVSSHVPEGFGYPELLIDKQSNSLNLTEYSFAIYSNNHLTYKFGDYAYNTFFLFRDNFKFDTFFDYNNYRHYAIKISSEKYLIISREITPTTLKIVVFSIIFLLLSVISVILYLIIYARKAFHLFRFNFKARLQTFIISTLTLTFILTGVTTLIYIKDSNRQNLEEQLTEKTNSVLIELQHKLSSVTDLNKTDRKVLHKLLRKFSLVFFSDINLYDKSGQLIATSRPEIFEKNLLSSYINPLAFTAIFHKNKLNFITEENIGSLKYYSAYVPINLNNDRPIGIVNLPYFARQTQITKSYYIMLSYLINIYVIIGIIGALIAIIFSKFLTKPLVLLQESIANLRIDKHNEKIQWNKNDEIGLLINEYNLMVDKLEQSAELLKHSERESAWREVARQIAHEIKNPLTPMKLNVQYLEKAYKNNDPEFASKIKSISNSLITQIDVLDDVAEMFSDFAKSKSIKLTKVNLKNAISDSVNLFNKNKNVNISINYSNNNDELITLGFEKDILRVITNIIKNAIQAVEKSKEAIIKIDVEQDTKFISVGITDNGRGISEEMKTQIFHPYFTTKTSGTGLGLAIVKNIMNEIGGKVNFELPNNGGTKFILMFPIAK